MTHFRSDSFSKKLIFAVSYLENDPFSKWPIFEMAHYRSKSSSNWRIFEVTYSMKWFMSDGLGHQFRNELVPEVSHFRSEGPWMGSFLKWIFFKNDSSWTVCDLINALMKRFKAKFIFKNSFLNLKVFLSRRLELFLIRGQLDHPLLSGLLLDLLQLFAPYVI